MKTKIVFVLDRSGSMGGFEKDVIGGFNAFVGEQKKIEGKAFLTTVLFDDRYEILYNNVNIQDVDKLTTREYYVRGTTALLDAVGKTITAVEEGVSKKDKVIFIINTDGYENSSVEYTKDTVKAMIERLEDKKKWSFVFLGAGIDAFAEGGSIGIANSFSYAPTCRGYETAFLATTKMVSNFRTDDGKIHVEDLSSMSEEYESTK